MSTPALIGIFLLTLIHLFSHRLKNLDGLPRSRWLSLAGGIAVAYAMVHLLPELHEFSKVVSQTHKSVVDASERLIWFMALLGLVVFYGLESLVVKQKKNNDQAVISNELFWLHMFSYALYNLLIGYLFLHESRSLESVITFTVGIGLHFVVNDHSLSNHHKAPYIKYGRWLLSFTFIVGALGGLALDLSRSVAGFVLAFLAGGILLNTFKEEIPSERESHFGFFLTGSIGYSLFLLLI